MSWLTELRFCDPLDTKEIISEMLFPANLLDSNENKKAVQLQRWLHDALLLYNTDAISVWSSNIN